MSPTEVRVSVDGTDIFIDYGDGSCLPPNVKERRVAVRALKEAIGLLKRPVMDEICDRQGAVGQKLKPKAERTRLRLVKN